MENTDHLLNGSDIFTRTPYERGVFAYDWRYRKTPTAEELEIFKNSTMGLEQCLREFEKGVQDSLHFAADKAREAANTRKRG